MYRNLQKQQWNSTQLLKRNWRDTENWRCQKILKNGKKTTLCIHTAITILATQQLYNLQFQLTVHNFVNFKISGINFSSFGDCLLEIFGKLRGNSSSSVNFSVTLHHFHFVHHYTTSPTDRGKVRLCPQPQQLHESLGHCRSNLTNIH